jgi:hypothetical protein
MKMKDVFRTNTRQDSPLDASGGTDASPAVSDFLTLQSLTNFAAMTGAITAAWHGLETLYAPLSALWVPYAFAGGWAVISILISVPAFQKDGKRDVGSCLAAVFIAIINALVLGSAVVGAGFVTTPGRGQS